jgi:glycosyltransferase involved in cell wall biosynthesis
MLHPSLTPPPMAEAPHQTEAFPRHVEARPVVALIPAYNEERFIGSLILQVKSYVDVVVVVDDGSRDQTAAIAERAGATVVRQLRNQGKAAATNTGLNYVRGLDPIAVVMLDGDGQHYADDIPVVLAPVIDGAADIVVGSRFLDVKSDIPAYRQVGQHGLTIATNLASGVRVSDSQSGYRAFSERAVAELTFGQGGFSLESEMQFLAREHDLRVAEVPIKVLYAEPAKRNPFKHAAQVVNGIVKLVGQSRPLIYFSVAGLPLLIAGTLMGLLVIDIFSRTGVLAIGYALVTVLFSILGMLLLFTGVILHSTRGMLVELRRTMVARMSREGWRA